MQDIETDPRLKPTVARVKWLEDDIKWAIIPINKQTENLCGTPLDNKNHWQDDPNADRYLLEYRYPECLSMVRREKTWQACEDFLNNRVKKDIMGFAEFVSNLTNEIKHLSLFNRLKRMFKR